MGDVRIRKQKLKDDLELLESGFENRISKVSNILPDISPASAIKKHPLKSVGIAMMAGMALGLLSKKSHKNRTGERYHSGSNENNGFTSLIFSELKRVAAMRAASYISEMVEKKMKGDE